MSSTLTGQPGTKVRPQGWPTVPAPVPAPASARTETAAHSAGLPFFIFCVYTFVLIGRPQDYLPALAPLRLALVFTILTPLATLFVTGDRAGSVLRHTETKLYFVLFGVMCAGIPFSIYRRESFNFVILIYLANMAYYVMFVTHVNTLSKFKQIIFVLVLSSLIFSLVGLMQGKFEAGRFVTGSKMFDPNDVAFVEVSLLAFAVCIILGSARVLTKTLAFTSALLSILLALYTGSRGGLLGLATFFLLFLALRIPKLQKSHKIALCAVVVALALMSMDKINVARYLTLTNLGSDYNSSEEQGRAQVWVRGLQLLVDDPLTGVGVNGFAQAIGNMRDEENLTPVWQAPHNSYVQVFTETGIFGGLAFTLLLITCLKTFNSFRRRTEGATIGTDGDRDLVPGILLIGFTAQLVSAFFLSQAYSTQFTLFFAASASLKEIAIARGARPA